MDGIKIPVGRSGFADIRRNGYYFIDKSGLIRELVRTDGTQVTLITRPRRFGKTLAMSMMAEFFDIRKNSADLFSGLLVSEDKELCGKWMNQYPTLFLSLRRVDGLDFAGAYAQLVTVIAELYKEHLYLIEEEKINAYDRVIFDKLASGDAPLEAVKNSLLKLTRMMQAVYGRPVLLFIDEYDVPLAKASEKGYGLQMLDVMKGLLQVIKDNDSLKFAVVTGCLKIAKESIFTGTNNFVSDTVSATRLDGYFGFTQQEVERLLADAGLAEQSGVMKEWYDGYHFGDSDVYCPWDVMNYVNDLLLNPGAKPSGYWKNSSDNAVIRSFIDYTSETITKKFEILLSGGYILQKIQEDLTYDSLFSSEENLWSVLYLTGYLTRFRGREPERENLRENLLALTIPNTEIKGIFEDTIKTWFEEKTRQWNRQALFSAVWGEDAKRVSSEMTKLLRKTISYHDYREDFYHAFFSGIFAGAGYVVESNREHGEGRSDIVVQDYAGDRVAVFEVKYSESQENLEKDCERALAQIDEKMYAKAFGEDYSQVICYGISFFKKRCQVRIKTGDGTGNNKCFPS